MDTSSEQLIPAPPEGPSSLRQEDPSGETEISEENEAKLPIVNGVAEESEVLVEQPESAILEQQNLDAKETSPEKLESATDRKTIPPETGGVAIGRTSPQSGESGVKKISPPRSDEGRAKKTSPPKSATESVKASGTDETDDGAAPPPVAEMGTGAPTEDSPTGSSAQSDASTVIANEEVDGQERRCRCCPTCLEIGTCVEAYNALYARAWHSSMGLIVWLAIFAIPISAMVMGVIYSADCPMNLAVPVMIFLMGVFGTCFCFYKVVQHIYNCWYNEFPNWIPNNIVICGCCAINVMLLLTEMTIILRHKISFDAGDDKTYCHPVLYTYAYWTNFVVLGIIALCVMFKTPACYRRGSS